MEKNYSDIRLKKNITPWEYSALDEISNIDFIEFEWDKTNDRVQFRPDGIQQGMAAQSTNLMKLEEPDGYLAINNSMQTLLNTKAVQELINKIILLENKIQELESAAK